MAWKGDGSGRKDSPRGGVSGGGGLAGGGRQGNSGGGFVSGMTGATARRSPVKSPAYEASLGNLAKLASRAIPGAGMVLGAGLDIAGARPGFTGYQGQVNTPGFADPKGGPQAMQGVDLASSRALLTGGQNSRMAPLRPNIAKAQALQPPVLKNPPSMAAQPWWRVPF